MPDRPAKAMPKKQPLRTCRYVDAMGERRGGQRSSVTTTRGGPKTKRNQSTGPKTTHRSRWRSTRVSTQPPYLGITDTPPRLHPAPKHTEAETGGPDRYEDDRSRYRLEWFVAGAILVLIAGGMWWWVARDGTGADTAAPSDEVPSATAGTSDLGATPSTERVSDGKSSDSDIDT